MTSFYAKALARWRRERGYRDPYLAIADAAGRMRGVTLSASDCQYLMADSAVSTVASNHYEEIMGLGDAQ